MTRQPRPIRRPVVDSLERRQLLASTELVTNGNFSSGSINWSLTGNFHADSAFSTGHSLPGYGYLSAADGTVASSNNLAGTLSQTVTIPAAATSATLWFYYKTTTNEAPGTNDTLAVKILNPITGTTLSTLATIANSTMSAYAQAVYDVSAYIGQSITLRFDGKTNATNGTVFRVDDVSLNAEIPSAAASLPAPTMVAPGTPTTAGLPTLNTPIPLVRWDPVSGAAGYGVILQRLVGGTYLTVANSEVSSFFASPIKGTTYTSPSPMPAGTYRWQVRAFDSTGKVTAYAPALYFALQTSGYNRAVGIDIYSGQSVTSWATVKTNGTTTTTDDTSFVWAKATEGFTFNDTDFAGYVTGARTAGVPLGGYHYARPENNTAANEAQHFFSRLTATGALAAGTNLVPMLDFESPGAASMTKAALSKWANDFCDAFLGLSGIVPIIYTFVSYSADHLDTSVLRYPLWQAQYDTTSLNPPMPINSDAPSATTPWPEGGWAIWQYTSNRSVGGIASPPVDGDVANADVATFLDAYKLPSKVAGLVTGVVFEDANGDGIRDTSEAGIGGRTVFLDADGDGLLDAGEQTYVTTSDGIYRFASLQQGYYQVRQIVPGTSLATTALTQSFKLAAGATESSRDFGSQLIDNTPPTLASSRFNYDVPAHTVTLVFSEDIGTTLSASDVTLTTGGTAVPFTFTYDAATRTAVFTPGGTLADGDYQLTIAAGGVSDAANNGNAAITVDFFWLAGDITRNRAVDFDDLVVLSQNYGTTGRTWATGDLTGDGAVDFDDLVVLSQSYGHTLPAAFRAPPPLLTTAPAKPVAKKRVASDIIT